MKRTSITFLLLAGFIGLILWYGYTIPVKYSVRVSEYYNQTASKIWSSIIQYNNYAAWHEDIYAVKELNATPGHQAWNEVDANGHAVPYVIIESVPNVRLVIQTEDRIMDYNYKRRYELVPDTTSSENGTTLIVTQDGEIHNFLFRIIAHFFTGHSYDIKTFLRSLNNKFSVETKAKILKKSLNSSNQ